MERGVERKSELISMQQMLQTISIVLPAWLSCLIKYSLALMLDDHLSESSKGAEREVIKPPPKRMAS